MKNLIISLNAIAPIFFMLCLGYFLKHVMHLEAGVLKAMNRLCFKVFLPLLLFYNIYTTNLSIALNFSLVFFVISAILITFCVLSVAVPKFEKIRCRQGVLIQGIFRSNFIILGIPICASLYGQEHLGEISVLTAFVVPLFNVLAVWTLSAHGTGHIPLRQVLLNVLKNPLIVATAIGILFLALHIKLPDCIFSSVTDLGKIATPLSILILGADFNPQQVGKNRRTVAVAVVSRLILLPAAVVSAALALGFRGSSIVAILAVFGTPTAISSYIMAEQMGGDAELAGELVMFSSMLSSFTLFVFIMVLKNALLI